jgi:hypothetical protein
VTFLNAALAFGALAFTVPLAIHLLFRSRFRTVDWGAMHLLDSVVRINRRRIQLLHLLLLLLRCLLPVLLAFCLARPVLTGFRSLPGDAPQTVVLAIDDSRSMSARDESGVSRIDRVKQQLGQMLEDLSRRDEVILVRSGNVDAPAATTGSQDAMRQLRQLRAQSGPVDLGRFLRAAVDAADQASYPRRRIVVVSDFPSHNSGDAAMRSLSQLATTLAEKSVRPVISFLNLGVNSDQLSNVSVESIDIQSPAVVAGRGARFVARLRNDSDTPARDLRVVWSIDGKPLDPRAISIPPRSTVSPRLSRRLDDVGVHELTVAVEHGDALIGDNTRSIGVDVIREIKVLLVDGKPSNRPLEGETDFLSIALSPFAFGGEDLPDAVRTTVVRENRLTKAMNADRPDIIVLANVAELNRDTKQAVSQFVVAGGALIVFDGGGVRTGFYNEPWIYPQDQWMLPAELGAFVGTEASREASPLPIGDHNPQYGPWQVLGSRDQQPFAEVDVYGYRKLDIRPLDTSGDPSSDQNVAADSFRSTPLTLLSMANGDPLVVLARRGQGQVVQFAVPCDAAWTTLPMRMIYLPMMQQLVLDLAGSRKQTTVDVGSGFSVPTSETASLLPADVVIQPSKPATFTVEAPGQSEINIKPTDEPSPQLIVGATRVAGTYRIRQTTPLRDQKPVVTSTLRVVEVPAIESQLRDTDSSRLSAAAGLVEANVYTDLATLQSDDRTRRYGREVWRWLLIGLLVAMIAELFLQQRAVRTPSVRAS